MKNILFLIFIIFTLSIYSQSQPSGYTPFLRLRLYSLGATPGADSLNQNSLDIDAGVSKINDTLYAMRSRMLQVIDYAGNIQTGKVTWASLNSSLQSILVTTNSTQFITSPKYFTNTLYADNIIPYQSTSNVGSSALPFSKVYSQDFIVTNGIGWGSVGGSAPYIFFDEGINSLRVVGNMKMSSLQIDTLNTSYVTGDIQPVGINKRIGKEDNNFNTVFVDTVLSPDTLYLLGKQGGTNILGNYSYNVREVIIDGSSDSLDVTQAIALKVRPIVDSVNVNRLTTSAPIKEGTIIIIINTSPIFTFFLENTANILTTNRITLSPYKSVTLIYVQIGISFKWIPISYANL